MGSNSPRVTLALALPSPVPGWRCLGDPWGWGRLGDPWGYWGHPWGYLGCTHCQTLGKTHSGLGWGWLWAQRGNAAGGIDTLCLQQGSETPAGAAAGDLPQETRVPFAPPRIFSASGGDLSPG